MRRFVEGEQCRHRQICLHFGETPKWERCDACDRCGVELDWLTDAEASPKLAAAAPRRRAAKPAVVHRIVDSAIRDALKEWRREMAKEMGMPPYVVMHDSTLDAICMRLPATIAELCEVPGIGEKRAERFGRRDPARSRPKVMDLQD